MASQYDALLKLAANVRTGLNVGQSPKYRSRLNEFLRTQQQTTAAPASNIERQIYNSPAGKKAYAASQAGAQGGTSEAPRRNVLNKVLDAISIGGYGAAAAGDNLVEGVKKGTFDGWDVLRGFSPVATALIPGDAGKVPIAEAIKQASPTDNYQGERRTFSNVFEDAEEVAGIRDENSTGQRVTNAGLGLVADIAFDPLTYVPVGGAALALAKMGKGVQGLDKIARTAEKVDNAFKPRVAESSKAVDYKAPEPKEIRDTAIGNPEIASGPAIDPEIPITSPVAAVTPPRGPLEISLSKSAPPSMRTIPSDDPADIGDFNVYTPRNLPRKDKKRFQVLEAKGDNLTPKEAEEFEALRQRAQSTAEAEKFSSTIYNVSNPVREPEIAEVIEKSPIPDTVNKNILDEVDIIKGADQAPAPAINPKTELENVAGEKLTPKKGDVMVNTMQKIYQTSAPNPAFSSKYQSSQAKFNNAVDDGTLSDDDLKPLFDFYKIEPDRELLKNKMMGNYSKTMKSMAANARNFEANKVAPDIIDDGTGVAAQALKESLAGQVDMARSRILKDVKTRRVGRYSDLDTEAAYQRGARKSLDLNIVKPKSAGAPKGKELPAANYRRRNNNPKDNSNTYWGSNNLRDQATAVSRLASEAAKIGKEQKLSKIATRNLVISFVKRYEDDMRELGYTPHLGDSRTIARPGATPGTGIPLGIGDIYQILSPKTLDNYIIHNQANAIQNATLMRAVEAALLAPSGTKKDLVELTAKAIRDADALEKAPSNAFKEIVTLNSRSGPVANKAFNPNAAEELAEDIVEHMPQFAEAIKMNSTAAGVRFGALVGELSLSTGMKLTSLIENGKPGDLVEEVFNLKRSITKDAERFNTPVDEFLVNGVMDEVGDKFADIGLNDPEIIADIAQQGENASKAVKILDNTELTNAEKATEITKIVSRNDDAAKEVATKVDEKVDTPNPTNAAEATNDIMTAVTVSSGKIWGLLGNGFNSNFGMVGNSAAIFKQRIDGLRSVTVRFAGEATKLSAKYSRADHLKMLSDFRNTGTSGDKDFDYLIRVAFDDSKFNVLTRAGITEDMLTKHLDKAGLFEAYHGIAYKGFQDADLPNNFDVLDTANRVFMAKMEAVQFRQMANVFSNMFGSAKKLDSNYFKPKFGDSFKDNMLADYIDKDLFYSREMIQSFAQMNKNLQGMDLMGKYGSNKAINEAMQLMKQVTSKWKLWNTVVRPGHHIKNAVGDFMLNIQAGHFGMTMYNDSARILMANDKNWKGIQGLENATKQLVDGVPETLPGSATRKFGNLDLSDEEIYRQGWAQNVMASFIVAEDLQMGMQGMDVVSNTARNAGNGPVGMLRKGASAIEHGGGKVSEIRENHVRMSHFVSAIKKTSKNNPKMTKEQVFAQAGAEVRKWHPNGTGQTNFENKYMKQAFMFYSWNRAILPLMFESFMMHPGRVSIAPKTMYAVANAMGMDLDHGFGNPFPTDEMYPDFLTDDVYGPLWTDENGEQKGIAPGIPQLDTLNDLGTPQRIANTAAGLANPIVRAPSEFITGQRWGAGNNIPITDKSEYVDSQIPLASYANNITGRSTSTLFTQPTTKAERGDVNSDSRAQTILNLLSGMGVKPYTSDRYREIAERDEAERNKNNAG